MKSPYDIALELGYSIAIPIVVLLFAGRLADNHFDTSPWFLIAGLLLSLPVVALTVYRKVKPFLDQP